MQSLLPWKLLLFCVFLPLQIHAQGYFLPSSGSGSQTTCSGTLYDDGGLGGSYAANASGQLTLVPAIAGNKIGLQFTSFDLETGFDFLYIYDGSSTAAPLLGRYDSSNPPTAVYATTAAGTLTIRLTSDNAVQRSGFAATISCVTTAPLTRPDLVIQNAAAVPGSARPGGRVTLTYSLANVSGVAAGTSYTRLYYSRDAVFDSNDRSIYTPSNSQVTLAGNQSASTSITFLLPPNAPPGLTVYILCIADAGSQVVEANETNNVAAVPVQVLAPVPGVDLLSITSESSAYNPPPTGAVPAGGTIAQVTCSVYNVGTQTASSSALDYYLSSDETLDANDALMESSAGGPLAPGFEFGQHSPRRATAPVVPPGTPAGRYYVLFVVDPQGVVAETDETNNVSAAGMVQVVTAGVDLLLSTARIIGASAAAPGSIVLAQYEIQNAGPSPASSSAIGFYLSSNTILEPADVLLTTLPGGPLGGNQTNGLMGVNLTIPPNTAAGAYYLLYVADPRGSVAETNEANNVSAVPLAVTVATAVRGQAVGCALTLVPNPVVETGQVTAYLSGAIKTGSATITVYSALGQLVHLQRVVLSSDHKQEIIVQTAHLAAGNYLLRLVGQEVNITSRLQVD